MVSGIRDSVFQQLTNVERVEIDLVAATAGTRWAMAAEHAALLPRVYVMTGDGSIDMTNAIATALVKPADAKAASTEETSLATGLVTYFTNIPAAADGACTIAFAVGGLGASHCVRAEMVQTSVSTSGRNTTYTFTRRGPSIDIKGTIALDGSSNLLLDDGSTALVALSTGTHPLVTAKGVVFGAFACTDVTDTIANNEVCKLVLWIRN